jgi:hypothetical protein
LVDRSFGAQGVDVGERFTEHFLIEEEQGGEGLVLGTGRDLMVLGQVGEERLGFIFWSESGGQVQAEIVEPSRPRAVGVLGAQGEVEQPDAVAHARDHLVASLHSEAQITEPSRGASAKTRVSISEAALVERGRRLVRPLRVA